MTALRDLDLLWARRLDPRAAALLDPPRTLTCWPVSLFNGIPAAVKLRSLRFRTVTVKSSDQRRPKFT